MSDIIIGVCGLVIFLVVVFVAGYFLYKFKNAQLTKAWGPLVGLVNGKVIGDGGGGATSWMTGTYKGRKVQASMTPDRNMYSSTSGASESVSGRFNYFEVALADIPGKHDWNVDYHRAVFGVGQTGWRAQSKDPDLEASLNAANIVSIISPFGEPPQYLSQPAVEYNYREKLLRFREDVGSQRVPTPERFAKELDLLLQLEEINAQVNPG